MCCSDQYSLTETLWNKIKVANDSPCSYAQFLMQWALKKKKKLRSIAIWKFRGMSHFSWKCPLYTKSGLPKYPPPPRYEKGTKQTCWNPLSWESGYFGDVCHFVSGRFSWKSWRGGISLYNLPSPGGGGQFHQSEAVPHPCELPLKKSTLNNSRRDQRHP